MAVNVRTVNIFPASNTRVKVEGVGTLTAPILSTQLTNMQILECINQKALVYQVLANGTTVPITLGNIKDDLQKEADEEEEKKATDLQKLQKEIDELKKTVDALRTTNVFKNMDDAKVFANGENAIVGQIVSVLINGSYKVYTVAADRSLTPADTTTPIFGSTVAATLYASDTTKSRVGEILSVYDSVTSKYYIYIINTDRTISLYPYPKDVDGLEITVIK